MNANGLLGALATTASKLHCIPRLHNSNAGIVSPRSIAACSSAQRQCSEHRFADWPCMLSTALCQCIDLHLLGLATVDYFSMAFFLKKLLATFSFQNLTFHSSCASNLTLPAASSTLPLVLQLELAWMHSTLDWRYAGGI